MERLDPDRLYVELRDGVTKTEPIIGRKYTLTHSDITGELFLTIGTKYAFDKFTMLRDEVIAEWRWDGSPFLYVYVYVDGQFDPVSTISRDEIFRRELPLALEAIRYGDRDLYFYYPGLDNAPVWVYFDTGSYDDNNLENWGYVKDYL